MRSLFESNLNGNPGLASRIFVSPRALSAKRGRAVIHEHVNPVGLVPTSSSWQAGNTEFITKPVDIDVTTLDFWATGSLIGQDPSAVISKKPISFLKIDVEGHEKELSKGAREAFAHDRPIIIVELLGGIDIDFFSNFIGELNYTDIVLFPGEARRLDIPRFEELAWNHVFCPVEKAWSFACTCRRIGLPIT